MPGAAPPEPHQLQGGEESCRGDHRAAQNVHHGGLSATDQTSRRAAGTGARLQPPARWRPEQEPPATAATAAVAAGGGEEREVEEAGRGGEQGQGLGRGGGLHGDGGEGSDGVICEDDETMRSFIRSSRGALCLWCGAEDVGLRGISFWFSGHTIGLAVRALPLR